MKKNSDLAQLPAVDSVLQNADLQPLARVCPRSQLVRWVRQAIEGIRFRILGGEPFDPNQLLDLVLSSVWQAYRSDENQALKRVINATGVMLHTNLGRAPLAEEAVERVQQTAGYTNLEFDLDRGTRGGRGVRACQLLCELTGAEDALIVNNCAAATILVLQATAAGREVIVSRGQLVEIGGGFRLPEVFVSAGVSLREVGTTNRTYVQDYEAAISEQTGAIIRVHHSNFLQTGFVTEPTIEELVGIARSAEIPLIDDVGSGCVLDEAMLSSLPLKGFREPIVRESVAKGADLCLFSGDKLFGGPQSGLIVGRKVWIQRLRSHPLMRALRVDKMTLAALEATAEIHLSGNARERLPFYQMLLKSPACIRHQCEEIVRRIEARSDVKIAVEPCSSPVGGGSIPGWEIPSFAVSIQVDASERLASVLRSSKPAIQSRQADGKVYLDLRTVMETDSGLVAEALQRALEVLKNETAGSDERKVAGGSHCISSDASPTRPASQ